MHKTRLILVPLLVLVVALLGVYMCGYKDDADNGSTDTTNEESTIQRAPTPELAAPGGETTLIDTSGDPNLR